MAHLVRTKVSIVTSSVVIIVLLTAVHNGFYRTPVLKRWHEQERITWNDFKGIPKFLSRDDAGISSGVFLEFDSISNRYIAYAGMNDVYSWKIAEGENLLKHEQYHFNITELFTRILNHDLAKLGTISPEEAHTKLVEINRALSDYQDRYDLETDHNLKQSKQNYWEFKVDSALHVYTESKGIVTDQLTGISAKFYKPHVFNSAISNKGIAYRGHAMNAYQMGFLIGSYQYVNVDSADFRSYCQSQIETDTTVLLSQKYSSSGAFQFVETSKVNKSNTQSMWEKFIFYRNNIYYALVIAPLDTTIKEYPLLKDRFFESISHQETNNYWIERSTSANEMLSATRRTAPKQIIDDKDAYNICVADNADNIFFKPPFYDEKGNLYIAYEILADRNEDVLHNVVLINRQGVFTWEVTSREQLLMLPDSLQPRSDFELEFGYILKNDSLNKCYHLYKQSRSVKVR